LNGRKDYLIRHVTAPYCVVQDHVITLIENLSHYPLKSDDIVFEKPRITIYGSTLTLQGNRVYPKHEWVEVPASGNEIHRNTKGIYYKRKTLLGLLPYGKLRPFILKSNVSFMLKDFQRMVFSFWILHETQDDIQPIRTEPREHA